MSETKKKRKPHAHFHMIGRQSIKFQISPMKDVRIVAGKDWTDGRADGRTDGMTDGRIHRQIIIISMPPPPPPPTSGDNG